MAEKLDFPAPLDRAGSTPKPPTDKAPRSPRVGAAGRQAPLQKRCNELIGSVGIMVATVNEIDGLAIIEGAERLSFALDNAAKQSPAFRRTLEAVLTTSVWGEVMLASGAIILPIALNHGLLPGSIAGTDFLKTPEASGANGDTPQS